MFSIFFKIITRTPMRLILWAALTLSTLIWGYDALLRADMLGNSRDVIPLYITTAQPDREYEGATINNPQIDVEITSKYSQVEYYMEYPRNAPLIPNPGFQVWIPEGARVGVMGAAGTSSIIPPMSQKIFDPQWIFINPRTNEGALHDMRVTQLQSEGEMARNFLDLAQYRIPTPIYDRQNISTSVIRLELAQKGTTHLGPMELQEGLSSEITVSHADIQKISPEAKMLTSESQKIIIQEETGIEHVDVVIKHKGIRYVLGEFSTAILTIALGALATLLASYYESRKRRAANSVVG